MSGENKRGFVGPSSCRGRPRLSGSTQRGLCSVCGDRSVLMAGASLSTSWASSSPTPELGEVGGSPRGARRHFTPKGLEQSLSLHQNKKITVKQTLSPLLLSLSPIQNGAPIPQSPLVNSCCLSHLRLHPLRHHPLWAFRLL